MALQILREIAKNLQDPGFYFTMGDKVTDVSNVFQVAICVSWIDDDLVPNDEFIGLKDMSCANADSIVAEIKHVLLRMNLKLNKCRGKCYDWCSTMSRHKNGMIKEEEKRAFYTRCYKHSLNLAIGDTDFLKHTIDNTFELTKLGKKSPK